MPPIQNRNGQQIKKTDSDRKYGGEAGQRQQEISRHGQRIGIGGHRGVGQGARGFGDAQRSAELIARFTASKDAADIGEGRAQDGAGFLEPLPHSGDRAVANVAHLVAAGAQSKADATDGNPAGDGVVLDPALRRGGQLNVSARALDRELHRVAAAQSHDARHFSAVGDQLAIDAGDQVARQEAGGGGRRFRLHLHNPGGPQLDADQAEQQGEDEDSQDEIGEGASRDDQGPLPQGLEIQVVLLGAGAVSGDDFLLQRVQTSLVRHARRIQIARELDVAAQRQPPQTPFDALLVRALEDGAAKADGETLHLHAEGARGQEVAQFMDGDDQGQHQQERHDIDQGLPKNS
ncbi:hypothetical protein D3C87_1265570 [compost metagenome]